MSRPTKAEGLRWLRARVGSMLDTTQVRASTGTTWEPGSRRLGWKGQRFALDGAAISLTANHDVVAVDDTSLTIVWRDEVGDPIHIITYREAAS